MVARSPTHQVEEETKRGSCFGWQRLTQVESSVDWIARIAFYLVWGPVSSRELSSAKIGDRLIF